MLVSVGDTLYSPILNVGSTVNGLYSVGWQQKRSRSLICLLVAITHKGSGATRTSRIKAVVLNEACFLPSLSNRNHGSSSFIWSAVFCALCCFAYCEKSFTCCRPLGSSPALEHFEISPSSSATVVYTTQGCRRGGGGAGGLSPPLQFQGGLTPLYFLQTIYSSVKGSISKIKSPENR